MSRHRSDVLLRRSSFLPPPSSLQPHSSSGFTLIEVVLGAMVIAIAIAAILGAYVGQVTLNEHARNLSLAIQDANRVVEQIRLQTSGCSSDLTANPPLPNIIPPGFATWDAWLGATKSILPDPVANERIVVTCQDADGNPNCVAAQGGDVVGGAPVGGPFDPMRVTVAVCWRHRGRVIGECDAVLAAADGTTPFAANNVIESPAMITTLVTCR